jgi:hypothetical protein
MKAKEMVEAVVAGRAVGDLLAEAIFGDRIYLVWDYPGLSGDRDYSKKNYAICMGSKIKGGGGASLVSGWHVDKEYRLGSQDKFWIKVRGITYKQVRESEALDYLKKNPYEFAYFEDPVTHWE